MYLNLETMETQKRNYSEIYNIINEHETHLNFFFKFGRVLTASSSTQDLTKSRNVITRYLKSPSDIPPASLSSSSGSHTQLLPRSVFMLHTRQDTRGPRPLSVHFTLGPQALHNAITRFVIDHLCCWLQHDSCLVKLHTFYLNVFC